MSQHLWTDASHWRRLSSTRGKGAFSGSCMICHEAHENAWTGEGAVKTLAPTAFNPYGEQRPGKPATVAELCFKCHGSPLRYFEGFKTARVGGAFSDQARSSHRIGSRGRADLPSLREMPKRATLDCTSCHGGSDASLFRGPHVSRYPKLLSAPYEVRSGIPESPDLYALCYQCHSRTSLLANESFLYHREHITGQSLPVPEAAQASRDLARGLQPRFSPPSLRPGRARTAIGKPVAGGITLPASCSACHDAHGSADAPSLIRFDRDLVLPNSLGQMAFQSTGPRSGACDLSCHGYDHIDARY